MRARGFHRDFPGPGVLACLLAAAVLASALAVVFVKHYNRMEFTELQQQQHRRDELHIDWGRLQLEHSAFRMHGHIEALAVARLGMQYPEQVEMVWVR